MNLIGFFFSMSGVLLIAMLCLIYHMIKSSRCERCVRRGRLQRRGQNEEVVSRSFIWELF